MKIKIFCQSDLRLLEEEVNEFINEKNIKITDIKYSASTAYSELVILYE